ncbi:MAG TPA: hypothetical protein VGK15_02415 [Candidatus Limnocylindria bacterium]|jgi:hypothetical protein
MTGEQLLQIALRIVHIGAGVFWVGTAWFFFGWVEPTTKAIGQQAGPFMHHIVSQRRITPVLIAVSTLNVLAGVTLYWRASGGLASAWLQSPTGIGFTIGGLAAIAAWGIGLRVIAPTVEALDHAGGAMAAAGRPPTPEEGAAFHALEVRLHRAGVADTVLLAAAVLMMATSRYL